MKINKNIYVLYFLILSIGCSGQIKEDCNRTTVDKSISKLLPDGICIPNGYTIEQVIEDFDFNKDGENDVALKYVKYPLQDGNMRYYAIYQQQSDTLFVLKKELENLAFPFIQSYSDNYQKQHPKVDSLLTLYPRGLKLLFDHDTIRLEHLIPDLYHKTYFFVYNASYGNWYLKKIKYWIGELPVWLVRNGDLREELLHERIYLEERTPDKHISIDEFDLIESKQIGDTEESTYFMNNYDVFEIGAKE